MPSPFPGMDPFLEPYWTSVHFHLIGAMERALRRVLPPDLRARAEENVLLEGEDLDPSYRPDLALIERAPIVATAPPSPKAAAAVGGRAPRSFDVQEVSAPIIVDRDIRITDAKDGHRLITAIELLSPWNKAAGGGCAKYLKKLDDFARAGVSVVEVDFVRFPTRARLRVGQQNLQPEERTPYLACVRRSWTPSRWTLYPIGLREPLPPIPVPLREHQADVNLDLQASLADAYDAGEYGDVNYARPLDPPFPEADARWIASILSTPPGR